LLVAASGQVPEECLFHEGGWHFGLEKSNCTALIQVALNARVPALTMDDPSLQMPLTTDGVFGKETAKALEAFQRRWHLRADGVAGPSTLSFLFPDAPLIQLVQLEAGHVHGVNATLEEEAKGGLRALLQMLRDAPTVGTSYRVFGRPQFLPRGSCAGLQSFAAANAVVPERWKVRGTLLDFGGACAAHAGCYEQLPKSEEHRLGCDEALWRDLAGECLERLEQQWPLAEVCLDWTAVYFVALRNFGSGLYEEAGVPLIGSKV
jgi:hypothetical protein